MPDRRRFLYQLPALVSGAAALGACAENSAAAPASRRPVVLSTWRHGQAANAAAYALLRAGGSALDAAEAGVRVTEADPEVRTVGIGSRPDRDGKVTLDACIMAPNGDCGSVAYLQDILHPVTVARQVMERTPHVMLCGQGARAFALAQGHEPVELLTEKSKTEWRAWRAENTPAIPPINVENHDTIGLLTLDQNGNLAGACTTSGAAYKYAGRIGDSPLIGAGLYVDNEVGAATATGWGEAVIRACGTFLVVELMRQGHSPQRACELAVERVISKNPDWKNIQVGFIALNKAGEHGAYCIAPGFDYALQAPGTNNRLFDAASRL